MSQQKPLWHRLGFSQMYIDVAKRVGYCGFVISELAERFRDLVEQYGAKELAEVYQEMLTFEKNRVMLNPAARKGCFMLLGPAPEQWDWFYRHPDGSPCERPPDRITPPVLPDREIDPITDGLRPLTATELDMRLRQSWAVLRKKSAEHARQLALETIPRVESEMIRRGMEIPTDIEKPAAVQPKAEEPTDAEPDPSDPGIALEGYARIAKEKSKRSLLCMLREARKKLAHHGRHSFAGKEAKKELAAAEAELLSRKMEIPPEGQETAAWEKKK